MINVNLGQKSSLVFLTRSSSAGDTNKLSQGYKFQDGIWCGITHLNYKGS